MISPAHLIPRGTRAWVTVSLALGLPACMTPLIHLEQPAEWPDSIRAWVLHPDQGWDQSPWSWWATAWVHGSAPHLHQNLAALVALMLLAWISAISKRAALAWFIAWPMTHVGMLMRPELNTYIGMSGVLHAGAAIIALYQMMEPKQRPFRWIGLILAAGMGIKILMENPWTTVLFMSKSSAINVAPWAHFCGLMAGLIGGGLTLLMARRSPPNSSVITRH